MFQSKERRPVFDRFEGVSRVKTAALEQGARPIVLPLRFLRSRLSFPGCRTMLAPGNLPVSRLRPQNPPLQTGATGGVPGASASRYPADDAVVGLEKLLIGDGSDGAVQLGDVDGEFFVIAACFVLKNADGKGFAE